jgi:hypothetical protein
LLFGGAIISEYVLQTAKTPAGPIGKFRLTVNKGDPANVVSLRGLDLAVTGTTTLEAEWTNFVPDGDLLILP